MQEGFPVHPMASGQIVGQASGQDLPQATPEMCGERPGWEGVRGFFALKSEPVSEVKIHFVRD